MFNTRNSPLSSNPPRDLLHYTLNSGDTRVSPRSEVSDQAMQCLRTIVDQGGEIPGTSGMTLTVTRYSAGAMFMIWHGLPIINAALACTDEAERELWPALFSTYRDIFGDPPQLGNQPAARPDRLPWLGIIMLPPLFEPTPAAMMALSILGDLERCIAWTYYESEFGSLRRDHKAKLIKQTGEVIPIQPGNGRNFTCKELQALVGGNIQIISPPSVTGAIMVVNEYGKGIPGLQKNLFASSAWQQYSESGSPRSLDDVFGDVVLCHTTQVH